MAKTVTLQKVETPEEQSNAALSMLKHALSQPDQPVEYLREVMNFYREIKADEARQQYETDLSHLQAAQPPVARKGRAHNNKPYARYEDIRDAYRSVMAEYGFSLTHRITQDEKTMTVVSILGHKSGHSGETSITLPQDMSGSKNPVQGWGSTASYGKRYGALMLLGTSLTDDIDDDDGNAAGATDLMDPISDEQRETLQKLITSTKTDINKFLAVAGSESLSDVPKGAFNRLHGFLKAKAGIK